MQITGTSKNRRTRLSLFSSYIFPSLFIFLVRVAMTPAIFAVAAALDGFPALLIPNHRSDDQDDNRGQCQTNNPSSHLSLPPFYYFA
jgi:hypothetical protein